MTTALVADYLNMGLDLAHWSTTDLWLAALALGADLSWADIDTIRSGERVVSQVEYDLLAIALNEHFSDCDMDHPMREWADLSQA